VRGADSTVVTLSIGLATIRPRLTGLLIATVTTTRDFSPH
jgi:hypothetical protein